jgi:predicted RNA binding protein YcfA (HicA-like mRNA interferase family)
MGKTGKEIAAELLAKGYSFQNQKGSHAKYKGPEGQVVIVPMNNKEIPKGTMGSIRRQMAAKPQTPKKESGILGAVRNSGNAKKAAESARKDDKKPKKKGR